MAPQISIWQEAPSLVQRMIARGLMSVKPPLPLKTDSDYTAARSGLSVQDLHKKHYQARLARAAAKGLTPTEHHKIEHAKRKAKLNEIRKAING